MFDGYLFFKKRFHTVQRALINNNVKLQSDIVAERLKSCLDLEMTVSLYARNTCKYQSQVDSGCDGSELKTGLCSLLIYLKPLIL